MADVRAVDVDSPGQASIRSATQSKEKKESFISTFWTLIKMARPQLLLIFSGIFCAAIVGGSHSGKAVIFGKTIGSLNICRSATDVRVSAAFYGLLFFLLAIVEFFANVGLHSSRRTGHRISTAATLHPPAALSDIGLVPQDSFLFSGTIALNISLGSTPGLPEPSQNELEEAARATGIHDTIAALPQGYETRLGPTGAKVLSGGQRQRICIARALVRKPRLLLLDESSSALDAESEALWEAALDRVRAESKVTVIAVAHRLRTIMKADRIYVIDKGIVLDAGTHNELISRRDKYREGVIHQSLL